MTGDAARPASDRPVAVVLGGTGCVGGGACAALAGQGYDVHVVARRPVDDPPGHRFTQIDVATAGRAALVRTLADAAVVVNATGGWLPTEVDDERQHVHLVAELVEAVAALPGRPRLVQVGSIHEYGPVPAGGAVDESVDPRPTTSYARTKLAGSRLVLDATRAGRIDGVVLRAVNVYGPHVTPASFLGTVVDRLRTAATEGGRVELAVADVQRDFVDVRDLADAIARGATAAPATGRVVNIGRGEALPLRDLVRLVASTAGLPLELAPGTSVGSRGAGWTRADIGLARALLGWSPLFGPQESVRDMWRAAAGPEDTDTDPGH